MTIEIGDVYWWKDIKNHSSHWGYVTDFDKNGNLIVKEYNTGQVWIIPEDNLVLYN